MKKIEELYEEILQDEGLKAEFVEAAKDNQMEAFLQKNDCNATLTEVQEFAEKKQRELVSLPDAELDATSGGANLGEAFMSIMTLGVMCIYYAFRSIGGPDGNHGELLCSDPEPPGEPWA